MVCTALSCLCAGEEKALEVQEPESAEGEDDEEEREGEADQAAGAEEEEPLAVADESQDLPESCKPKMKLFSGKLAAGLRIRSEPSCMVSQIRFLLTCHPQLSKLGTSVALPLANFIGWKCLSRHWL